MNDVDSERLQGADQDAAPDAASAPEACDWDFSDPESLQAVWLEFQREMSAACPVTETEFDVALSQHPAEDDSDVAEISVACERCGRRATFSPPDAKEVFGWAE